MVLNYFQGQRKPITCLLLCQQGLLVLVKALLKVIEIFIFPESQQFEFKTGKAEGWFITKDPSGRGE